ncbi:gliding motility lipoprotein GldH [uncultured Draconibacterium sp.]|uniref:gliding motility lipoprotein GldH n=1 Tax=uncultured Draconibacterium sp. TaxID=1573823 RepID=UPI0032614CE8
MNRILQSIIFATVLFVTASCDNRRVFDQYKSIPKSSWQKDSLVVFNVPVDDTLQNHNLFINVRNELNYRYSNLWLFVTIEQPGGTALKDTFELVLADPTGKWLGQGFGGLKTRQAVYRRNVFFPHSGTYFIRLQHGMRDEELEGIADVGFRVEKIK